MTHPDPSVASFASAPGPPALGDIGAARVVPWEDAVVDSLGYDPRSTYVELFWLGLLGPTSTWLLRRLAARFDEEPEGFALDPDRTARALGIGVATGRAGPLARAMERCCRFGLAQPLGEDVLAVRRKLPPLSRVQVQRLSPAQRSAHREWVEKQLRRDSPVRLATHGARLARSLLAVGLPAGEIEEQLRHWQFPEPVCRRVLQEALGSADESPGPEAA